jgi:hypothetical protein
MEYLSREGLDVDTIKLGLASGYPPNHRDGVGSMGVVLQDEG